MRPLLARYSRVQPWRAPLESCGPFLYCQLMRFSASFFLLPIWLLAAIVFSGCFPSALGPSDEEKEPHFLEGKSRVNTLDFQGAVECFEKALEANPQSASAHFELAWIFDQKEVDPAAAIYHYQQYLKLRPNPGNLEMVRQRVLACKQELARTVTLGPVTEKVQKELDQLTQENKRLAEENKKLHADLEKWMAYAGTLQALTNRPAPSERRVQDSLPTAVTPTSSSNQTAIVRAMTTSAKPARSHVIQSGETLSSIAKKYGVKLDSLMAANPKLDAKRLRVGQVVALPAS